MKQKLLSFFVVFVCTTALWASNTITYTATSKLPECTSTYDKGLHTNAFNVSISSHTFSNGIGTITFSGEVTRIGEFAFFGCHGMTSIDIPNSIDTIEVYAFHGCDGLTSIDIPNSVNTIGSYAFNYCSGLTSVTIPNSATEIGQRAFSGCSGLTSVTAPASFFDIEEEYWPTTSKQLTSVIVNGGELNENELLFINRSYKTLKTLDVSAVTNTEFADEAFKGCYNLETLVLPQSLEHVGYMMVAGCINLKSINIPAAVSEIDQRAFEDCRSIETITFGGTQTPKAPAMEMMRTTTSSSALKKIGNWAFYNAHELQNLTLPEGVEEVGEGAFYGCVYMEDLALPHSNQDDW